MSRSKEYYESKIGEVNYSNFGSRMTIIEFNNSKDIVVEYENGFRLKTRYPEFKSGSVKSPYDRSVFKVGYIGEGCYKVSVGGKHTIHYHYWYDMLKRCYDPRYSEKHNTYSDKTVCEEWHNFQNFAKWFDENYYTVDNGERIELDKDIIKKHNKIYSPDTCIFIPKRLNTLFVKKDKNRGKYPIGVTHSGKRYQASVCRTISKGVHKTIHLGTFDTPEEAFEIYKQAKEDYIKEMADEYKDKIPQKLYDAMYRYEVDITD